MEIGQKVYSPTFGFGVIEAIYPGLIYVALRNWGGTYIRTDAQNDYVVVV
jgi:hypothetical protein